MRADIASVALSSLHHPPWNAGPGTDREGLMSVKGTTAQLFRWRLTHLYASSARMASGTTTDFDSDLVLYKRPLLYAFNLLLLSMQLPWTNQSSQHLFLAKCLKHTTVPWQPTGKNKTKPTPLARDANSPTTLNLSPRPPSLQPHPKYMLWVSADTPHSAFPSSSEKP